MNSQPREPARVQKGAVALCAIALALTVCASPAAADPFTGIDLFGVPSGSLNFQTVAGSGNQLLTFFDLGGGAASFLVADTPVSFGVYEIGSSTREILQTLPGGGAFFVVGQQPTSSFDFKDTEGDFLAGIITWVAVAETVAPASLREFEQGIDTLQLEGTLSYNVGSSSSAAFTALFGGSGSVPINLSGTLECTSIPVESCTLGGLAASPEGTGSATLGNSTLAPVPEPASVILLGFGLAAIRATTSRSRQSERRGLWRRRDKGREPSF